MTHAIEPIGAQIIPKCSQFMGGIKIVAKSTLETMTISTLAITALKLVFSWQLSSFSERIVTLIAVEIGFVKGLHTASRDPNRMVSFGGIALVIAINIGIIVMAKLSAK